VPTFKKYFYQCIRNRGEDSFPSKPQKAEVIQLIQKHRHAAVFFLLTAGKD
jgi:hypothetical protein